jgi:hypothetical protein
MAMKNKRAWFIWTAKLAELLKETCLLQHGCEISTSVQYHFFVNLCFSRELQSCTMYHNTSS